MSRPTYLIFDDNKPDFLTYAYAGLMGIVLIIASPAILVIAAVSLPCYLLGRLMFKFFGDWL